MSSWDDGSGSSRLSDPPTNYESPDSSMQHLPLTLDTLQENLALDEALLDAAEAGELSGEVLRLWESPDYGVVLGRSSDVGTEVHLAACRKAGIPVLRRSSGGGTIVAGPGCLMYAVVLSLEANPQLRDIHAAHCYVLSKLAKIFASTAFAPTEFAPTVPKIEVAGISDLILGGEAMQKFSGNAMRLKRNHLLYHGTLLYDFDLARTDRLLATPTRVPEYRQQRQHTAFLANLPLSRETILSALVEGWQAKEMLPNWPQDRTRALVQQRYTNASRWVLHQPQT